MPESHPPSHQAPIPESLRTQLEQFKKRLWHIKIAEAILAGFFGLLFSFLLVFGLDRFIETSTTLRLIILIAGVSLFAVFAPYWIHRWVFGHRRENQLARLISRRFPKLGDRLLGAVELQDQTEAKDTLSPALRAAAMRTVAADAASKDLAEALPAARHRKWSLAVMALFIGAVAALVTAPDASINALKRWLMPLSHTERYTFTRLDLSGINTPHRIPYGEAFSITIPLAGETNHRPETARARYGNGEWVQATLTDNAYTFHFKGQRAQDTVCIEADDARHSLPFEPVIRPELQNIRAAVTLPAYLQRPSVSLDLRSGFATILEGSHIKIQATATRSLSSATAEIITQPAESAADASTPPPPRTIPLKVNGRKITTPDIPLTTHPLVIPIRWRDIYGLTADTPLKLRLQTTQDQPPSTYIQGIDRQHIMLAEETIRFDVLAEDDYGLKTCGISWQGEFTRPTGGPPAKGERTIAQGSPTRTSLSSPFSFSPANLSIEPQKIILRSWTEDYKPGRGRIYSQPVTLYILTRNEHAQVLKNEFDRAIGELEDIARKEQNLNDENQRIQRRHAKDLQSEQARKKLQQQQDAERDNRERMRALSENMEKLFKDSVRNGEIDKETLKKMAKALQAMKELARQDLPKIEQKLESAQSKRNTKQKSQQDLNDAIEQQKKALAKMKQALKDANEANQNFEASTFVNRLKRAASEENGIASNFIHIIDNIIGKQYAELDPADQRAVKKSYDQQRQTASDVRWIQEDLAHYFARTQKPGHQKLLDAMRESKIDEQLEDLATRVSRNLSYDSIASSKHWAKQLRKWAKQLDGQRNGGGGGSGGGGGAQSQEDKDFEFMLKVMRMIQKEQDIRARTRALEDLRRTIKPAANPNS